MHAYPLLESMFKDMESAPALYQPTHFWEKGMQLLLDDIYHHGIENFRSLKSAMNFFVPVYGLSCYDCDESVIHQEMAERFQANKLTNVCWQLAVTKFLSGEMHAFNDYRVFLASCKDSAPYIERASESRTGNPKEQFSFDGKNYSRSFLNYLLGINFLKQHCDLSGVHNVLEIGGGFGSLGEILLKDSRSEYFYIDVDIPPASFAATYYLQQVFGTQDIGGYDTLSKKKVLDISRLKSSYKGLVICPWQLAQLKGEIDLFVNFISFQEMEPEVVKNYLQQINRLKAKFILLRNIREGKKKAVGNEIGVREPIKGEDYDNYLPNYRLIATNTVPYGYLTMDNFHSELRVYQSL